MHVKELQCGTNEHSINMNFSIRAYIEHLGLQDLDSVMWKEISDSSPISSTSSSVLSKLFSLSELPFDYLSNKENHAHDIGLR